MPNAGMNQEASTAAVSGAMKEFMIPLDLY